MFKKYVRDTTLTANIQCRCNC